MARISRISSVLLHAMRVSVVGTVVYTGLVMAVVVVAVWQFPVPGV
ncbi:hypothetical protein [Rhodococcus tibetensis]|uniref:Uncharacterized protein n=1 Tax=Rhodococcus tibetensis TaxID=2965064 RepID=A0ABT1QEP9_9NOCA|nr:hypothetical protein [Rhodococcus sp. FXJ9.536]MCQ4120751.1 hypothetical protein [Rhodococcus sp. FXJ9.536]